MTAEAGTNEVIVTSCTETWPLARVVDTLDTKTDVEEEEVVVVGMVMVGVEIGGSETKVVHDEPKSVSSEVEVTGTVMVAGLDMVVVEPG